MCHKFHLSCIFDWFKSGGNFCPICKSVNIKKYHIANNDERIGMLSNYSRRKNADPMIVNIMECYRNIKNEMNDCRKELKTFEKENKAVFDKEKELAKKYHSKRKELSSIKRKIYSLPIVPIVIHKTIHTNQPQHMIYNDDFDY